ncbi:SUMF1/EgtB/PvdO family nonheme iron enzyme [Leptothoe sp. EHU-05/26/07-4]
MVQIFLAHAHEDKVAVIDLYNRLKARGFKPWLDKVDLLPGQSWRAEIPKAIRGSDVFIACLSQQSIHKRGYVQREFRMALQEMANKPAGQIYFIPLRLDDCQIPELRQEDYGISFIDYQWLNFFEPDGFEQLVRVIEYSFPNALNRPKSESKASLEKEIAQLRKALESLATRLSTSERTERNVFIFNNSQFAGGFAETVQGSQSGGTINNQTFDKAISTNSAPNAVPKQTNTSPSSLPTFSFEVVKVNSTGDIKSREEKTTEYYRENLINGVYLDLVKIPGGRFWMGSSESEAGRLDDEAQHKVQVPVFWMGKYPVTQAQWHSVSLLDDVDRALKPDPSHFIGDNRPVECVSWYDAVEFCKRLSVHTGQKYRLPSEAEWEYACRAGTTSPFYFGPTITTELANYRGIDRKFRNKIYSGSYGAGPKGSFREQTMDVGSFSPNKFGLYDMHGNVWEYCQDYLHNNYASDPIDRDIGGTNDNEAYRVMRGGSWGDRPRNCRSANRCDCAPDEFGNFTGFRVACSKLADSSAPTK